MAYKNTGVYSSKKQYDEAKMKETQMRDEIQAAVIANAPTEEIREALRAAIKKNNK
jgi:hypothetical protein